MDHIVRCCTAFHDSWNEPRFRCLILHQEKVYLMTDLGYIYMYCIVHSAQDKVSYDFFKVHVEN